MEKTKFTNQDITLRNRLGMFVLFRNFTQANWMGLKLDLVSQFAGEAQRAATYAK